MEKSSDQGFEAPKPAESPKPVSDILARLKPMAPLTARLDAGVKDTAATAAPAETVAPAALENAPADPVSAEPESRWHLPAYAPLAAGIALAAVVGALAGAGTTATLLHDNSPPASLAATEASYPLRDNVAQLGSELAALKAGIAGVQRSANAQFGKLAERIERSEKAQEKAIAEPAAKLARIQESIDRLEKRQQQAAVTAAPEVTGSIVPKDESKPLVAQGWRLHDFYDGRAVVESRNGTLFRVGRGSNLPGLGKVANVKRENGRVVVVTAGGIIAGPLRPPQRALDYYRW